MAVLFYTFEYSIQLTYIVNQHDFFKNTQKYLKNPSDITRAGATLNVIRAHHRGGAIARFGYIIYDILYLILLYLITVI